MVTPPFLVIHVITEVYLVVPSSPPLPEDSSTRGCSHNHSILRHCEQQQLNTLPACLSPYTPEAAKSSLEPSNTSFQ